MFAVFFLLAIGFSVARGSTHASLPAETRQLLATHLLAPHERQYEEVELRDDEEECLVCWLLALQEEIPQAVTTGRLPGARYFRPSVRAKVVRAVIDLLAGLPRGEFDAFARALYVVPDPDEVVVTQEAVITILGRGLLTELQKQLLPGWAVPRFTSSAMVPPLAPIVDRRIIAFLRLLVVVRERVYRLCSMSYLIRAGAVVVERRPMPRRKWPFWGVKTHASLFKACVFCLGHDRLLFPSRPTEPPDEQPEVPSTTDGAAGLEALGEFLADF